MKMVRENKIKTLLLVIPVEIKLLLSVVVLGAVTAEDVEEEEKNDANGYIDSNAAAGFRLRLGVLEQTLLK